MTDKTILTEDRALDGLFDDDRHLPFEHAPISGRFPMYGSNSLEKPGRALTMEEADLIDDIGVPRLSSGPDTK